MFNHNHTNTLKYVSPEYQAQLDNLAEMLCTPERFRPLGQLALFEEIDTSSYAEVADSLIVPDIAGRDVLRGA